jgi:deoxyhypusine synthase
MTKGPISQFIERHFLHFNAAALVDAARAYEKQLDEGAKMMVTLAGAMSTGELGCSLAEMIRQDKVHIITCTGANLEEDVFNLVAHDHYKRIPHYRQLSPAEEQALYNEHYNRVTDTCIPEEEALRRIERQVAVLWEKARDESKRYFPHEYFYQLFASGVLVHEYQIVPGWEDSTLGNIFAAHCITDALPPGIVKGGIEYMIELADWYTRESSGGIGFFQIGGGIAGDFPICVVPMLHQDLEQENVPLWSYFCQISDSTTSYGSYSGAVPNEKITWGKLGESTPKFIIESDASIVAPLVFAWVLGW